jgi:glycosyltransferase involved in cell wall biosynthesis
MKVAILGPYPLDTERLGGVEVAIVYVQRELCKMPDVELHIITCKEQLTEPRQVERDGAVVTYLPRARLGRLTNHRREVAAMGEALRALQPDIVHAHGSGLYAGGALAAPYPSVLTVHGIISQEAKLLTEWPARLRAYLDVRYERSVVRRTRHLMLITPYVAQVFDGLFTGTTYLVENACDERFFELERRPVAGRLLFAGPVIPRKGVLPLVRALARARKVAPDAHLRVAGSLTTDPAYVQTCREVARELGVEQSVTFLGHLAQEQVLEEYATCAAFVLPSFQETAPMVVEQAMAAGVPSVATAAGGTPWMLEEGVTGHILPLPPMPEGDPVALGDALGRLLADPAEAERMGRRAQQVANERFRPEQVARRTWEVYQQVIEASR